MNKKRLPEILKNNKVVILSGMAIIAFIVMVVGFEFTALNELGGLNAKEAGVLAISFVIIVSAILIVVAFNLNATKKREKAIEKRLQVSDTLINCITILTEEHNINRAIDSLLKVLNDYFKGDRAYLFEFDYEKQTTSNSYEYATDGITPQIDVLQDIPLNVIDSWIKMFEETGTFYISSIDKDVDKESDTYRILEMQGIESLIAVPLIDNGKIIGFLGIDNPKLNYNALSLLSAATFFILDSIDRRESHATLERLSFEDTLTGVFNRNSFNHDIEKLKKHRLNDVGIAFFDINGLKEVNDTKGHVEGDRLIKAAAEVISSVFSGETYRIGGDEFVVIAVGSDEKAFNRGVEAVLEKLALEKISTSVGVSVADNTEHIEAHLTSADSRMYENKKAYYK